MAKYPAAIAHRGMSSLAPENTMAAFAKCIDHGVSAFEFDVDVLSDGSVIVIHDDTLDRTTSGSGGYYDLTFSDIRKLDAGKWFSTTYTFERIPELVSVVEFINATSLEANLEVKPSKSGPELRNALIDGVIVSLGTLKDSNMILISSFDMDLLTSLKARAPQYRRATLFDYDPEQPIMSQVAHWIEEATRLEATAIHPSNEGLTKEAVEAMVEAGFQVNVWTVNDLERAEELASWGVHAVFTDIAQDFPVEAREAHPISEA
ncbi:MAG: glycerophosphodiester phosphodiesterase family protein [Actinomycetaceae bacterium]|nr:glycerophosphodiester phosphodiesterase family protein [Actinomycetaceae bacterium]